MHWHNGNKDQRDRGGTATGAISIGDFFKRTADNAGLNEGVPRPEKV